jgi:hypothetical protein
MPVRANKQTLLQRLQTALEIEFATIPAYLVALLSIKLPGNRQAAERIRSVMIEEMLHLALVANVMNAVGGKPRLDKRALPKYPLQMDFKGEAFADRRFPINLAAFSASTIDTFLQIEMPRAEPEKAALFVAKIDVPGLTIGDFYQQIVDLLEDIDRRIPGGLFTGDPATQIEGDYYWAGGGRVIAVRDLTTAKAALQLVISQGEGAWPRAPGAASTGFGEPLSMGHYYRFKEIACGRRYETTDDPSSDPTGPEIDVDYGAVYPIKENPSAKDFPPGSKLASLNQAFNRRYTMMVAQLQDSLSGNPKTLYTAIMDSMHELTPLAHEMMKLPIAPGARDTGCPTFDWLPASALAVRART